MMNDEKGSPQERIANRLSVPQKSLSDHLAEMPSLNTMLNTSVRFVESHFLDIRTIVEAQE
jgi:hypothetical protein